MVSSIKAIGIIRTLMLQLHLSYKAKQKRFFMDNIKYIEGTYYHRNGYDALLPKQAEFQGLESCDTENTLCYKFRAAACSENMASGEIFHLLPDVAEKFYTRPSNRQGRGIIYA